MKVPQFVHLVAMSRPSTAASQNGFVVSSANESCSIAGYTPWRMSAIPYLRSSVPLTGSDAGPPVTNAISAPSTWLTATPRSCSTASRTCVMPMM